MVNFDEVLSNRNIVMGLYVFISEDCQYDSLY